MRGGGGRLSCSLNHGVGRGALPPCMGCLAEYRAWVGGVGWGVGLRHLRQAAWTTPVRSMGLIWTAGGDCGTQRSIVSLYSSLPEFTWHLFCEHLF